MSRRAIYSLNPIPQSISPFILDTGVGTGAREQPSSGWTCLRVWVCVVVEWSEGCTVERSFLE